jgi:hypothetical protein
MPPTLRPFAAHPAIHSQWEESSGPICLGPARSVPSGNSPSPLFFVSDRNTGLEALSFLSVLK